MNHMLFWTIMSLSIAAVVKPLVRPRLFRPIGCTMEIRRFYRPLKNHKDFIDVEVIEDEKGSQQKPIKRPKDEESKDISSTLFNLAKGAVNTVSSSIARVFGEDEETKRKKELKRKMNSEIDTMLKGTGIVGGVFGSVMKSVGGMVMESVADAANDISDIQDCIRDMLENDEKCTDILGSPVSCSPPFSTASNSMTVNGASQRRVVLAFRVQGYRGTGQVDTRVRFEGSGRNKKMAIEDAVLHTDTGFSIKLRSGGGDRKGTKGTVIEAEIL